MIHTAGGIIKETPTESRLNTAELLISSFLRGAPLSAVHELIGLCMLDEQEV